MSRIRLAAAVAALVGLAVVTTPAHAQYSETSAWITPFAGVYFGGSLDPVSNAYGINDLDVGTAFTFGARLGYKFNNSIGLVFEYAHADPTMTVRGGLAGGGVNQQLDMSTNVYEATFNFYFGNTPDMMGYIAIGGGADNFSVTGADSLGNERSGSTTEFGTVFGLGGTKMFNEKAGITLDGRYRWVNVNGSDSYYCGWYGCYAYDTSWYGSGEVTLGLVYKFK